MTIQTKTIGRLPVYLGDYDNTRSYGKKNRVTLYGSEFESKHDNNNTAPATWDGAETVTFNTTDWQVISNGTDAWIAGNDKPAQSQDYPYNGMGYVVLKKNIQDVSGTDKNLLTQDMFYKGDVGSRVPNTDTIFEIRYAFELAENITIPSGCVLKFEGGSISNTTGNSYTLTGTATQIEAGKEAIFTYMTIAGTWNCPYITSAWFSDASNNNVSKQLINLTSDNVENIVVFENGTFNVSVSENKESVFAVKSNTKVIVLGEIVLATNAFKYYNIFDVNGKKNVCIEGSGNIKGDYPSHTGDLGHGFGIRITNGSELINIHDTEISYCSGDSIYVGKSTDETTPPPLSVTIDMVHLHHSARQGVTVTHGKSIIISNCIIDNIGGSTPEAAIDIEPNPGQTTENIIIQNCTCTNNGSGIHVFTSEGTINNVIVQNNYTSSIAISSQNTTISNNQVIGYGRLINTSSRSQNVIIEGNYVEQLDDVAEEIVCGIQGTNIDIRNNHFISRVNTLFAVYGSNKYLENNILSAPILFDTSNNVKFTKIANNTLYGRINNTFETAVVDGNIFYPYLETDEQQTSLAAYQNIHFSSYHCVFSNNTLYSPALIAGTDTSTFVEIKNNRFLVDKFYDNRSVLRSLYANIESNYFNITDRTDEEPAVTNEPTAIIIANETVYIRHNSLNSSRTIRGIQFSSSSSGTNNITIGSNYFGEKSKEIYYNSQQKYVFFEEELNNVGNVRPTPSFVGFQFFDTSLGTNGKPIYYAGLDGNNDPVWVDATGASV